MTPSAFAIAFGPPKARRWLALQFSDGAHSSGWREFIWTPQPDHAFTFQTETAAASFARSMIPHDRYALVPLYPVQAPTVVA